MQERDVILKFEYDEQNYIARTCLTKDELEELVDLVREHHEELKDHLFLLKELESNNYLKVISKAPEIIEIW